MSNSSSNYPIQLDSSLNIPVVTDNFSPVIASNINKLRDAIFAIEQTMGLVPQATYGTIRARLDVVEDAIGQAGETNVTISGDLGGAYNDVIVVGLQNHPILNSLPSIHQVLSFDGYAWGPSVTPSVGSDRSVQFANSGFLGGAPHVSISTDGFLEISKDKSGGAAQRGDIRLSSQSALYIRNSLGTNDLGFSYSYGYSSPYSGADVEQLFLGSAGDSFNPNIHNFDIINIDAYQSTVISAIGNTNNNNDSATIAVAAPGNYYTGGAARMSGVIAAPNLMVTNFNTLGSLNYDPFGGGRGLFLLNDLQVAGSGNPTNGFWLWADPGNHHPTIKLPNGISYDLISSNSAAGNNRSIQYNGSGLFNGATHASISSDGYLQLSNDRAGGSALTGDLRFAPKASTNIRNISGTKDLPLFSTSGATSPGTNSLIFGARTDGYVGDPTLLFDSVGTNANTLAFLQVIGTPIGQPAQVVVFAANYKSGSTSSGVHLSPNSYFGNQNNFNSIISGNQPFRDGYGVIVVQDNLSLPTSAPTGGFDLWSDSSTHHPKVRLPNGNIYDLLNDNPGGSTNSVQFNNGTAFSGATHVSIASDGYLQLANDKPGGSALTGDLRVPFSFSLNGRNSQNSHDLPLIKFIGSIGLPDGYEANRLIFGGNGASPAIDTSVNTIENYSNESWGAYINPTSGVGNILAGISLVGNDPYGNGNPIVGGYAYPNFAFINDPNPTHFITSDGVDPFQGAKGVIFVKDIGTLPSGNPITGFYLWSNSSTHHPTVQLPNGNVYDLLNGNPSGSSNSIQFNNSGVFGGANHASVSSDGYLTIDGYQIINFASANPSINPVGGNILYGDSSDGYLKYRKPDGSVISLNGAGTSGGLTASSHEALHQSIHFLPDGPSTGYSSLAYKETLPLNSPFPTSIIWWQSSAKTGKIFSKDLTYNTNKTVSQIVYKMYDVDGITLLETITDNIAYLGVFESNRTRTIA